jgi:hypothetical protein
VFGTGAANQGAKEFVGLGVVAKKEEETAEIQATGGTVTGFRCYQAKAAAAARTFTLDKGTPVAFAATTWTCTIAKGAVSGTGTNSGGAVAYSPGDTLDIALPAAIDGQEASFAVSVE